MRASPCDHRLCDRSIRHALAELFRVLRPSRTYQRDLGPALVSLERAHYSLHELDMYTIAIRILVHGQHGHKKMDTVCRSKTKKTFEFNGTVTRYTPLDCHDIAYALHTR
jgi:hypothetical protein